MEHILSLKRSIVGHAIYFLKSLFIFVNLNWKKHRWCALDLNPGRHDGRRRWIHWATAAPGHNIVWYLSRQFPPKVLKLHLLLHIWLKMITKTRQERFAIEKHFNFVVVSIMVYSFYVYVFDMVSFFKKWPISASFWLFSSFSH